jgi:hypothetical protein
MQSAAPPTRKRYTRAILQGILQLMGCKPWHAHEIAEQVFQELLLRQAAAISPNSAAAGTAPERLGTRSSKIVERAEFFDGRMAL